jgi:hypothetical protein
MNKNIVGYCGYIGLISFVAYRPVNTSRGDVPTVPPQTVLQRAKLY